MPYYEHHLLKVRELSQSSRTPLSDLVIVKSTLPGHEGVPHIWAGDSFHAEAVELDAIRNSGQHSLSMISLNQGHLYTRADTGRHQPIQSPKTTKKRATASWSSRRPIGTREVQKRSHSCSICGKEYTQMQGVRRHIRTKHHPSSCLLCDFKWARPEHYRNHLTKRHDLELSDIDEIIGKPAGSRCRTTIIGRDLIKNVSPHAIQHDRQAHPDVHQRPLMPPLSSVANVSHLPSACSPIEVVAQSMNDAVYHAHRSSQTHSGRSTPAYALVEPSDGTYHHTHPVWETILAAWPLPILC